MITTYLLWKFYNTRLLNASSITKHIIWLPRRARGILILTLRKPVNCPLQVESNFFPIRIIMRGAGQPKIHPKSNISNSHHAPSRLPWLSHKNTTQWDNTYIVYNILLYLSMKNEWVQQLLHYLSFYWKRNKLCYVMLWYQSCWLTG